MKASSSVSWTERQETERTMWLHATVYVCKFLAHKHTHTHTHTHTHNTHTRSTCLTLGIPGSSQRSSPLNPHTSSPASDASNKHLNFTNCNSSLIDSLIRLIPSLLGRRPALTVGVFSVPSWSEISCPELILNTYKISMRKMRKTDADSLTDSMFSRCTAEDFDFRLQAVYARRIKQ